MGGPPYELIVSLHPNKKSAEQLPFPKGEQPPELIVFTNAKEAANLLLGQKKYLTLMSEEHKYTEEEVMNGAQFKTYKGFAKVTIDRYKTAVECDSRWYKARLLSVEPLSIKLSAKNSGHLPC